MHHDLDRPRDRSPLHGTKYALVGDQGAEVRQGLADFLRPSSGRGPLLDRSRLSRYLQAGSARIRTAGYHQPPDSWVQDDIAHPSNG